MKILFLGSDPKPLVPWLQEQGEQVVFTAEPLTAAILKEKDPDLVISYNYRHLIKREILDLLKRPAVNLHISYLPWNRGADPNPWSLLENTPSGVTIHLIDEGIDTGAILFQRKVNFAAQDALSNSYQRLQMEIQDLFKQNWQAIKNNHLKPLSQNGSGSFHALKDREKFLACLGTEGWDVPIEKFKARYQAQSNP